MSAIEHKSPMRRVALVAVGLSTVAVAVAAVAVVIAFVALSRAGSRPGPPVRPPPPPGAPPGIAAPGVPPPDVASSPPSAATASHPPVEYAVAYENKVLKIPAGTNCAVEVEIDIDTPMIDGGSADFPRYGCGGPDAFQFESTWVSDEATPSSSAAECADRITVAPLRKGASIGLPTLHEGDALCLITNREAASEQGVPQRITRLVVTDLEQDGTVVVTLTTWNVPE